MIQSVSFCLGFFLVLVKTTVVCYSISITRVQKKGGVSLFIEIDFNSDESIYIQLMNQIIWGIATGQIREGDSLPSVRQMAESIGINMHTVNKAYAVLKQEGFLTLDRRRGAMIVIDYNKAKALAEMKNSLRIVLARGMCKNISREEVHHLIDEIIEESRMY